MHIPMNRPIPTHIRKDNPATIDSSGLSSGVAVGVTEECWRKNLSTTIDTPSCYFVCLVYGEDADGRGFTAKQLG